MASLLSILATKHAFVKSMLAAGKIPTPAMLGSFLQSTVVELRPHVQAAPPTVGEALKSGLATIGWSSATNSPIPGSSPPQPDAVAAFLAATLRNLLPDVPTARAAVVESRKSLNEEEREVSMMEEEAADGALSGKQVKALTASQARLPALRAAASEAAKVLALVEAQLSASELEAADEAEAATRGVESLRVAQLTKDAAEAAAGKGGGRGGGGGGGGGKGGGGGGKGGGRGSGGGSGGFDRDADREARSAEAAARLATKAAADAKAAEDTIAALRSSDITLVEASELRKGGYVLLPVGNRAEPCKVQELTTSKTGKHGHAKIAVTATDVASGRKVERNLRADERVTVPGKRWIMAIAGVAGD